MRTRLLVLAAVGALAAGWLPAQAGPGVLPPACDPTVSGLGVPGCPSTLVGQVGDIENPSIQLPDLVPDVTETYVTYSSIEFNSTTGQWTYGAASLNFDTRAQNLGSVPLQLTADDPTSATGSTVSQCVSWTTNLVCREKVPVGGFVWHQEHLHYHYQGFAAYELRSLLADGEVDFSDAGLLAASPKVSFCLIDSLKVQPDASPVPRYNTCNPDEEGISPGWTDVYTSDLEGQTLSLDGLSDGRYAIVINLNTAHRVQETSTDNNRVIAVVDITGIGQFSPVAAIVEKHQG